MLGTIVGWVSFQSTPSARRATAGIKAIGHRTIISIHALREEGDSWSDRQMRCPKRFQSTPSARRATLCKLGGFLRGIISIHALREEGDQDGLDRLCCRSYFNPRPPRGERRCVAKTSYSDSRFQSTPSARRATRTMHRVQNPQKNFNPRPPRGGRHSYKDSSIHTYLFQSTPSARRAT